MAADWIKMRSDMYRHPKISVIADELLRAGGRLSAHVGSVQGREMSVTRSVMRNATVGALVSVWGVMRLRGERNGDDLLCKGVDASVLDDISDLPGFGAAMIAAGWLISGELGITFPRFFQEHNVDPAERARTKNADRQKRFRERKKAEKQGVTRNVTVTPRERVEEEEELSTPAVVVTDTTDSFVPSYIGSLEGHSAPVATPNPAAALAIALTRAGFSCTSMNPNLAEAAAEGVSVEHLTEIAGWPECKGKSAGYVIAIARRERADGAQRPAKPISHGNEVKHATRIARSAITPAEECLKHIEARGGGEWGLGGDTVGAIEGSATRIE